MLTIRRAADRGHFNHGWLDTYHTFSFADYYDPAQMGFRPLRVMNEDRVAPGMGFGMHGHRDMEIVTIVLSGALQHRDSLGNGEVLRPGEFQRMSAGSGIRHSEFNPSETEPVHLYQVWLLPRANGLPPSYEQKPFDPASRQNAWQLVASPDGAAGSLTIQQDARIYLANLSAGQTLQHQLAPGRHAWLQVISGAGTLSSGTSSGGTPNASELSTSDGVAISDERELALAAQTPLEVMLFDLP